MLPDPSALALFVGAAVALVLVPGPAVIYIVAQSIDQGRIAGLVSALGIGAGGLVHVAAATLGLSSLVLSSATAFTVVKYAGAAYLVLLGLRRIFGRVEADLRVRRQKTLRRLFSQGAVVNVLNPKAALFFVAFLPQFVDVSRGAVALQIATLGMLFVGIALVSDGLYALLAGTLGGWLKGNARFLRGQRYAAGSVFVGLGVATAFSGARQAK